MIRCEETSHAFILPAGLDRRSGAPSPEEIESEVAAIHRDVDELCLELYEIEPLDRQAIEEFSLKAVRAPDEISSSEDADAYDDSSSNDDDDEQEAFPLEFGQLLGLSGSHSAASIRASQQASAIYRPSPNRSIRCLRARLACTLKARNQPTAPTSSSTTKGTPKDLAGACSALGRARRSRGARRLARLARARVLPAAHQDVLEEPSQGADLLAARDALGQLLGLALHPRLHQGHALPRPERLRRAQARARGAPARDAHATRLGPIPSPRSARRSRRRRPSSRSCAPSSTR